MTAFALIAAMVAVAMPSPPAGFSHPRGHAPMTGIDLVSKMVALAAPTSHGRAVVVCHGDTLTAPGISLIQLSRSDCGEVRRVILHRHAGPEQFAGGLWSLLYGAGLVGQAREGQPLHEHDAECRALMGLPRALQSLRYSRQMVAITTAYMRDSLAASPPPWGGRCD